MGTLLRVELRGKAGINRDFNDAIVFLFGTVTPFDSIGLGQLSNSLDPDNKLLMFCRGVYLSSHKSKGIDRIAICDIFHKQQEA